MIALALALQAAAVAPQQPADRWFAEDKAHHFLMSTAVVAFAGGGARTMMAADNAVIAGVVASVTAGLWKEWKDQREGKPFSKRDLVWDALGIALGVVIVSRAR